METSGSSMDTCGRLHTSGRRVVFSRTSPHIGALREPQPIYAERSRFKYNQYVLCSFHSLNSQTSARPQAAPLPAWNLSSSRPAFLNRVGHQNCAPGPHKLGYDLNYVNGVFEHLSHGDQFDRLCPLRASPRINGSWNSVGVTVCTT